MALVATAENVKALVDGLNFAEKVERSLRLIREAYEAYGDHLVVANSLGKDSCVVWDLAKRVSPKIPGFIVTTRFKPRETVEFMGQTVALHPELKVYRNDSEIPERLYETAPDRCCDVLKVEPTRRAISEMNVECWVTGLRCTEGRTRTDFQEVEERDKGLIKLNPILIWHEREVWQYLALYLVPVNPLYKAGYRSLGCSPCTKIANGPDERAGRWIGTSKCGGECGIHTRPLKSEIRGDR
jgi:phosphoadenosine phosphosulfate reductase